MVGQYSCMAKAYCTSFFTGKVSHRSTKTIKLSISNDLQYTVQIKYAALVIFYNYFPIFIFLSQQG